MIQRPQENDDLYNLRCYLLNNTNVLLKWEIKDPASFQVDKFVIEILPNDSNLWKKVGETEGICKSFEVSSLSKYTKYFARVYAIYKFGIVGEPVELTEPFQIDNNKDLPTSPLNLKILTSDEFSITLGWQPPDSNENCQVTQYEVEICDIFCNAWSSATIVEGNVLSAKITNLKPGAGYYVKVTAINEHGKSKKSSELFEPVYARALPSAPKNLRVKEISDTEVTLEWDFSADSKVAQYFIDFKEEHDTDFLPAGRVDGQKNNFTCDFLRSSRSYTFRIKAKNEAGFSKQTTLLNQFIKLTDTIGYFSYFFIY
ncbi:hypothetical protein HELRODRAFT_166899 [Helobdella robusta]|uniref:Fibronectin type-III domain-containing protein n=1 Tax=Helobdella robusta TaxID=6412 RepID=T1EYQ6_HELRO|nr:hypothetical protein HELRODRAFT_166899 [Helobdella robusta]ESO11839.1 hypothetical protein HELRODRAFT_166899 [Helobdella robusta]